jgi:dTDP-4-dehydrorhamnose reductase
MREAFSAWSMAEWTNAGTGLICMGLRLRRRGSTGVVLLNVLNPVEVMMSLSEQILRQIQREAPPQQSALDVPLRRRLCGLTAQLLCTMPDSGQELEYYLGIRDRTIPIADGAVSAAVTGATVVVTGGSGCVGTVLLEELREFAPARLFSLANTPPARPVPGVSYVHMDVRDGEAIDRFCQAERPDLVFHLAAQRDPGLAERQVARTACTNVLGTRNVVSAAQRAGIKRVVYASTGKAIRPYTRDVYASSKRVGEWVMGRAAADGGTACSAVRFTHVVDNSIILERLLRWCHERDVVRLHAADTVFYAQSARESARLMLVAATAPDDGSCRLHMIRDLGWPVGLLPLALGVMMREDILVPLYVAGHDPGYEERPYPGLYDPLVAGDVSPLMNAMEAGRVEPAASPAVDAVPVTAPEVPRLEMCLAELEELASRSQIESVEGTARRVLDEGAYELLVATVRATPRAVVDRIVRLADAHRSTMLDEHLCIDDVFREAAVPVTTAA